MYSKRKNSNEQTQNENARLREERINDSAYNNRYATGIKFTGDINRIPIYSGEICLDDGYGRVNHLYDESATIEEQILDEQLKGK